MILFYLTIITIITLTILLSIAFISYEFFILFWKVIHISIFKSISTFKLYFCKFTSYSRHILCFIYIYIHTHYDIWLCNFLRLFAVVSLKITWQKTYINDICTEIFFIYVLYWRSLTLWFDIKNILNVLKTNYQQWWGASNFYFVLVCQ